MSRVKKSTPDRIKSFLGQTIRDITGVEADTYSIEIVTDAGIFHVSVTSRETLFVSIGHMVTEKVDQATALEWMEKRTVKDTEIINANNNCITFTDETQVIITSAPDVELDQKLVYSVVRREDEDIN